MQNVLSARQASGLHCEEIILIQHTLKPRNALQSVPLFEFSIEVLKTSESRRAVFVGLNHFCFVTHFSGTLKKKQQLFILNAEKLGELKESQCVTQLRGVFDSFPSVMSIDMIIYN